MNELTCIDVVSRAGDYLDSVLDPGEAARVTEHLEGCADCAAYMAQLRTTIDVLARRPGIEVPAPLREAVDGMNAGAGEGGDLRRAFAEHGPRLLALARAIDPGHAEDLVQSTWVQALRQADPDAFELRSLLSTLGDLADRHSVTDVETEQPRRDRATEVSRMEPDPYADPAELFYPDLYQEGPDLGGWIKSPNSWPGPAQILAPDEDVTTTELYGVVDAALDELPPAGAELLSLVDVQGVPSELAIRTLGLDPVTARRELHRARNHVRDRLDKYLARSEAS
ncbi:zf-HC2 domain-containing protein [Nonomuraea sp. KM90]|uniref:zf-HC2 domain-containing protein n=1 Tax=Nonomuraea sp. KM90 TaxID=3457428 RepID=UPI003FCCB582